MTRSVAILVLLGVISTIAAAASGYSSRMSGPVVPGSSVRLSVAATLDLCRENHVKLGVQDTAVCQTARDQRRSAVIDGVRDGSIVALLAALGITFVVRRRERPPGGAAPAA